MRPSGRTHGRPDTPHPAQPRHRPRGQRLAPPRDTGIVLAAPRPGLSAKRPARGPRGRDDWMLPLAGVMLLLIGAGLAAYWGTLKPPPQPTPTAVTVPSPLGFATPKLSQAPSPLFATYGALRIHLPVPAEAVTTVSFHQATFNHAQPMVSLVPDMPLANAKAIAGELRAKAGGTATSTPAADAAKAEEAARQVAAGTWKGSVIRLYRSGRSGKPDTAVDVGAPPGTPVVAPVDGTVVLVRTYRLYNKYDDFEVHIAPKDQGDVDVVVIHIADVAVSPGQEVKGGLTRIASVRQLSNLTDLQLKDYTADGGDHCHLQVNRLPAPGMLWISTPGGIKTVPFQTAADASGTASVTAPATQ